MYNNMIHMEEEDNWLDLGLGLGDYVTKLEKTRNKIKPLVCLDLSFNSSPKEDSIVYHKAGGSSVEDEEEDDYAKKSSGNTINGRKKLRLTTQQSRLLEDTFKVHTTLNPAQKQALAEQLNLKPRQVEVWFQNRRARTKLKQTEVDCEFLKKCCESLSDENKRLKRELEEVYNQLPKSATTISTKCRFRCGP